MAGNKVHEKEDAQFRLIEGNSLFRSKEYGVKIGPHGFGLGISYKKGPEIPIDPFSFLEFVKNEVVKTVSMIQYRNMSFRKVEEKERRV